MRNGTTLLELIVVLSAVAVLAGLAFLPASRFVDAVRVRDATAAVLGACAMARQAAIGRSAAATVLVDTAPARLTVIAGADTLLSDHLDARLGVALSTTGRAVTYAADGLGWGLSNLRIVARRGAASDTVTVSRLGRARR